MLNDTRVEIIGNILSWDWVGVALVLIDCGRCEVPISVTQLGGG